MNMPGGRLELDVSTDSVTMKGPALRVFDGCFSGALLATLGSRALCGKAKGML
jgi:hypothetical protein